ncbi:MAG: PTS glucitol/sorbitol transporter subunit IIB [Anaerostipes sp.]|nr:PTS glucitol/sorbitol transporter subunit IIB [Anaerostipes sp.]MDD3747427.1 PTS glucitol/sorbitol transporter subunit IIB [Anaerostipes sp.]
MYKTVTVKAGSNGWGGPLTLTPTETCNKILSVTGGGVHPLAQHIADLTGCEAVDGFKTNLPDEEVLAAVVDCGGTARCGVYPKKGIYTINIEPVGKAGPLAKFITPEIYVSAVKEADVFESDANGGAAGTPASAAASAPADNAPKSKAQAKEEIAKATEGKKENIITRIGKAVGHFVNIFFQAGRDTIEIVLGTILPFMAFTATLLGIISASGLGNVIAKTISPICSTLPGMVIIAFICGIPILSPVLGPGAVIAQVVGTLLGAEFAKGNIPPQYALPALFAIDAQVGCDFVPVGLSLGEAEPETIEYGVPAVLFERMLTGPLAVLIAFAFSFGMY